MLFSVSLYIFLLLLLLSCFSRVQPHRRQPTRLPPSLGFSRQEHWSGLPFPSPMHESEKWKWRCSVVSDSVRPHGLQPTRLLPPSMGFSRQEHWSGVPLLEWGAVAGVGCRCLLHGCTASPLSIHLLWASRLLPCPSYCKQYCYEHWNICIFFNYGFLRA